MKRMDITKWAKELEQFDKTYTERLQKLKSKASTEEEFTNKAEEEFWKLMAELGMDLKKYQTAIDVLGYLFDDLLFNPIRKN